MSKIVIDARELRTSTGRYIERLLYYLQRIDQKHDYTILLKPQDMTSWRPSNPRFQAMVCTYKEFTFGEQLGFKKQLAGLSADLVHFGMTQQPVLYRGRTVTTVHDLTTTRFQNPDKNPVLYKVKQCVYRWVIKRVARKSTALLTPTQFVKDDLVAFSGIDPAKVIVTLEAADPIVEAAESLSELVGKDFIMYVGRPTPHKNLERLLEAFAVLQVDRPDLRLVLAGKTDANYRRIAAAVQARELQNVVFTGFISEGQLRWLYENCAAYVFPSLSEGFGLPGLEAMLHGAPVVASNATCLPEVYGAAAHYFDPHDISAMAAAVNDVLTDKKLRAQLIKNGHTQAKKYSWQTMAKQTLALYEQVLADKQ
ncbi:MAG TPA: glycosyltransferase family 1 protein [Candidatus Saccharimonadales bacterium]|nr:glycosyltransferase family 1 protein [Candidatus Saccharimonadales bacterium]